MNLYQRQLIQHTGNFFSEEMKNGFSLEGGHKEIVAADGTLYSITAKDETAIFYYETPHQMASSHSYLKIKPFTVDNVFAFANHEYEELTRKIV